MKSMLKGKIYFGWWTVLATGIVSGAGVGFYAYGFSALFKPIASELGFSRAATSGAPGIGMMIGSLLAPVVGIIVDRFGPRLTILAGLFTIVTGLTAMSMVDSLIGFYLVWGLILGLGLNLGLTVAIDKAMSNWFVRKIGLAVGAKFALISLVSAVLLPTISWLLSVIGWRMTCLVWAGIMFAGIPVILTFVKNRRPEHYGLLPDGDEPSSDADKGLDSENKGDSQSPGSQTEEYSLRQVIRTRVYWIMCLAIFIQICIIIGFSTHCIPFLTEMRIDPVVAGGMMGMMLICSIPSRLIVGFFADHFGHTGLSFLFVLPFLMLLTGLWSFLIYQSSFTIYLLLILFGIAHGLPMPIFIVMVNRLFGRKAFGAILGTSMMITAPASLVSPILTGWIFDTTGSYAVAFNLFAWLSFLSFFLFFFIKPPKNGTLGF
ncbi:MFS transporter [Thermodesulfobacteriota bacterium]